MSRLTRLKNNAVKQFPWLGTVQRQLYRFKPYSSKFRSYYVNRGWGDHESASGGGSTLAATIKVREELPKLFSELDVRLIVDAPCGDFHWMKEIALDNIQYVGLDIVPELIEANQSQYETASVQFRRGDLIKDALPKADLILCRDCLVHFPEKLIFRAIENMKRSKSRWLLTTTFTKLESNRDLQTAGLFRPINLTAPPFSFPPPTLILDEGRGDGKALGLWKLDEI